MTADELALEEELARSPLTRRVGARILPYVRRHGRLVALVLGLELLWVLSMLLGPHLVKIGIDVEIAHRSWDGLVTICAIYVANQFARMAIVVLQIRYASRAGLFILNDIRRDLFVHVQRLSMSYFDRTKEGRIIARVDRDVDALERAIVWGPMEFTSFLLSLVLVLSQMTWYDWRLALAVLATVPLLAFGSDVFRKKGIVAYRKVRETQSRITGHVAESVNGVRVLAAFVRQKEDVERLAAIQSEYNAHVDRAAFVWSAYLPFVGLVYAIATAVILGYGGTLVAQGEMQVGEVAAFVLLLGMLFGPIEGLGNLYNECLAATAAAERIFLLLDTSPDILDRPGALVLPPVEGRVRFHDVRFRYPTGRDERVLDGVDFELEPGKTLALVGRTGAGKSTIVKLLARFYEPVSGRIEIDGVDIGQVTLESLRRQIGMVPQDAFLFTGTVLSNLRYGRPAASEAEIHEAARRLGTHDFFQALSQGYQTQVKERGEGLSSGERQLIALTRALLVDPRLLMLDEATSAVDTLTERAIQEAIERLRRDRTTIVVAHRLSTIVRADTILVLEGGRVVERGDHASLMADLGVYANLYRSFVRL